MLNWFILIFIYLNFIACCCFFIYEINQLIFCFVCFFLFFFNVVIFCMHTHVMMSLKKSSNSFSFTFFLLFWWFFLFTLNCFSVSCFFIFNYYCVLAHEQVVIFSSIIFKKHFHMSHITCFFFLFYLILSFTWLFFIIFCWVSLLAEFWNIKISKFWST